MGRRRKHWGWGYEDEQPSDQELRAQAAFLSQHLGFGSADPEPAVPLSEVTLPPPSLAPPAPLAEVCSSDDHERALHAYGRSYRDVIRAFRGRFEHPPDVVARPTDERELESVLEWAIGAGAAVIPFGGGTSAVGGVEPAVDRERFAGVVTVDVTALDRVLEIDRVSLAARIQAGASGPVLEQQLRQSGLTLRHFPQSFEFSTLGGWIATRAGGHFATLYTHVDDLVESVRAVTPSGVWESRRLPGSGAGISPDRLLIGSEGTLGVITEAWVRVRERPRYRVSVGVRFADMLSGARAVRALSQSGLHPSNCRLIDAAEARLTGVGDGSSWRPARHPGSPDRAALESSGCALLVLGFESPAFDQSAVMALALECCGDHGGTWEGQGSAGAGTSRTPQGGRDDAVGSWREAFLRVPYVRDTLVAMGVLSETFETAITWDRFEEFLADVTARTERAVREVCGAGTVTCRLTHVYPDGPAPYFTVVAPARRGAELEQWAAIKAAASEAVLAGGGTITHHHAVGRDHRLWYDRQRPEPFAAALRAAKGELDPAGALNPGVLVDTFGTKGAI